MFIWCYFNIITKKTGKKMIESQWKLFYLFLFTVCSLCVILFMDITCAPRLRQLYFRFDMLLMWNLNCQTRIGVNFILKLCWPLAAQMYPFEPFWPLFWSLWTFWTLPTMMLWHFCQQIIHGSLVAWSILFHQIFFTIKTNSTFNLLL